MITGTVSRDGVPTINLEVGGKLWTAIIDTGFNGALELPTALKDRVKAEYVGEVSSLLAAGQRVKEDSYLVEIWFAGQVRQVQATFVSGNEILIGTRMLQQHRLEIDFPAGSVSISPAD